MTDQTKAQYALYLNQAGDNAFMIISQWQDDRANDKRPA